MGKPGYWKPLAEGVRELAMRRFLLLAALGGLASVAIAAPGGPIATLQLGAYVCELPGDATGAAGIRQPERDFAVLNASSYSSSGGRGTYLLTSNLVQMTSGPKKGERFIKLSSNFLRELDSAGNQTALRCVRQVVNNS
jgi:hypothetical protein